MDKVVVEIQIPVTVSYVEATCHDYCVTDVLNAFAKELESSLIAL